MVTIPQYEATKPLETSAQTMPNIRVSTAPYDALQNLGQAIGNVGEKFSAQQEKMDAQQRKLQDFKAQQGWLALGNDLDADFDTVSNQSTADDGSDIHPNFVASSFNPKVTEFIKKLPPELQEEYSARSAALESGYKSGATKLGNDRLVKSIDAGIDDYVNRLATDLTANPQNFESARVAAFDLINNSNKPSSAMKAEKQKVLDVLSETVVDTYIEQGDFEKARDFVKQQSVIRRTKEITKAPANRIKGVLTPENWNLSFYKPNDLLGRRPDERYIDATTAYAADELGRRFFQMTGKKVMINDPHKFDQGPVAGRRRGTSSTKNSPHVANSEHHVGRAIDFQWQTLNRKEKQVFLKTAMEMGYQGVGFYGEGGHIHLDMGNARQWGPVPGWAVPVLAQRGSRPKFGGAIPAAMESVDVIPNMSKASTWQKRIDVAEKQILKQAEGVKKELQTETYTEFTGRLFSEDRPISGKEVQDAYDKELLNPSQFRSLMRATKTQGAKDTKNETFKAFLDKAEKVSDKGGYDELNEEMVDAYADGLVSQTHMDMVLKRAKTVAGIETGPEKKNPVIPIYRKRLSVLTMPSDSSDKAGLIRRLDALEKFEMQIKDLKPEQLNRDTLRKIVDDIAKDSGEISKADKRSSLEMGVYIKGGRYAVSQQHIFDAAKRLRADKIANKISIEDYVKQSKILKLWTPKTLLISSSQTL